MFKPKPKIQIENNYHAKTATTIPTTPMKPEPYPLTAVAPLPMAIGLVLDGAPGDVNDPVPVGRVPVPNPPLTLTVGLAIIVWLSMVV